MGRGSGEWLEFRNSRKFFRLQPVDWRGGGGGGGVGAEGGWNARTVVKSLAATRGLLGLRVSVWGGGGWLGGLGGWGWRQVPLHLPSLLL